VHVGRLPPIWRPTDNRETGYAGGVQRVGVDGETADDEAEGVAVGAGSRRREQQSDTKQHRQIVPAADLPRKCISPFRTT
jgi:hypothetical protein